MPPHGPSPTKVAPNVNFPDDAAGNVNSYLSAAPRNAAPSATLRNTAKKTIDKSKANVKKHLQIGSRSANNANSMPLGPPTSLHDTVSSDFHDGSEESNNADRNSGFASRHDSPPPDIDEREASNRPDTENDYANLFARCCEGVPVPRGTPVCYSEDPNISDRVMLRSIQADNYKFIRHMIMCGWFPVDAQSSGFVITIHEADRDQTWEMMQATPLHYAICCGRFQAAVALLIAFPEFANMKCVVKTSSGEVGRWSPLDIAVRFAQLFAERSPRCFEFYRQVSLVLLYLYEGVPLVPFFLANSPCARLTLAGPSGEAVIEVFQKAVAAFEQR